MRIIAGTHKGRKLFSLPGKETRPTSGKVREAIFSICTGRVADANVLDLFAGTGAFGLEAISRGATTAVFVDSDRQGIEVIRKNIAACGTGDKTHVCCTDIQAGLNPVAATGISFDIVFMDPPYKSRAVRPTLENLARTPVMKKGAIIIVEHGPYEEIPTDITGMDVIDRRKYGKTLVTFFRWR